MTTARTSLVRGPGAVLFGAVVLHDADGIQAEIGTEAQRVTTSAQGEIDQWLSSRYGAVSFRPAGEITAGILAALYPHQTPSIGASLLGAVDVPLTVHSQAGVKVSFTAAALIGPPQLRLSASQTAFGSAAQFRALLGDDTAPEDTGALVAIATEAYSALTYPFLATNVFNGIYAGTYNSGDIVPRAGWTVDVALATEPIVTDHDGEIDIILTGVSVMAKCEPIGMSEADLAALVPYGSAQGASVRAGYDLVVTGGVGKIAVTLYDAHVLVGPMRWGTTSLRAGEIAFVAQRKLTAGVPGALYKVEIVAEPEA